MKKSLFLVYFCSLFFLIVGNTYAQQSRGRGAHLEWIKTDEKTWYEEQIFVIKHYIEKNKEYLAIPVQGARLRYHPYPARIDVDHVFSSRLDRFEFPSTIDSDLIRFISDLVFVDEVTARFTIYLDRDVSYSMKRLGKPNRIELALFRDPLKVLDRKPFYFVETYKTHDKKSSKRFMLELGTETKDKSLYQVALQGYGPLTARHYPMSKTEYKIWIGPFESVASANAGRADIYKKHIDAKEGDELMAFKQYLTHHLRPAEQGGFDVAPLRREFKEYYDSQKLRKVSFEADYEDIATKSRVIEY